MKTESSVQTQFLSAETVAHLVKTLVLPTARAALPVSACRLLALGSIRQVRAPVIPTMASSS